MNVHDLQDQMARSTEWTGSVPVDPAADIGRGRSRLRRRRAAAGVAGTASAAVVGVLAVNALAGVDGPVPEPPPAATASSSVKPPTKPSAQHQAQRALTLRYLAVLAGHADPRRSHLYFDLSRQPLMGSVSGGRFTGVLAEALWRQGGGAGYASVEVVTPGTYDIKDSRYSSTRCMEGLAERGVSAPEVVFRYDSCRWETAPNGRRVRVGTVVEGQVKGYYASYLRPDGLLVIARVDGDARGRDPLVAEPAPKPVAAPAVTVAALVQTVVDPRLTLR